MSDYNVNSIEVLDGISGIRVRPGMYIGNTSTKGFHHLLWEIIDNGVDEISNGYGDAIDIVLKEDGSVSVQDNGRGIPPDIDIEKKQSGIEIVFTYLHSGAKFNDSEYNFSGGLHGVGASVTNALSTWLKVTVWRNSRKYFMTFKSYTQNGKQYAGVIDRQLTSTPCDAGLHGTRVEFLPDKTIFEEEEFSYDTIKKRIREIAFLNKNLTINLTDERQRSEDGVAKRNTYCFSAGIVDFVRYMNAELNVTYAEPLAFEKLSNGYIVNCAFQHINDKYEENVFSYVNNIPTTDGGTHEVGFKSALTKFFNDYAREKNYLKDKDDNFSGEDLREGIVAVLSIKMKNIVFDGQTKTKLGNAQAKPIVESIVYDALKEIFSKLPKKTVDSLYQKFKASYDARIAAGKKKDSARKLNEINGSSLTGKVALPTNKKPELNEIFIVEGDSAGGSAKQGRDRRFQGILSLKGKPINCEKESVTKVLENEEIKTIIAALGCGFHKTFDISKLKYHKVVILADADYDGGHIRAILITFFYKYMRNLITNGNLYIGMPPLYKVEDKKGIRYAYDDKELDKLLQTATRGYKIQRYKGLGEMNPEQLWETTLNPETRKLTRVIIDDLASAEKMVSVFMSEKVSERKEYIYENADFNKKDNFMKVGE